MGKIGSRIRPKLYASVDEIEMEWVILKLVHATWTNNQRYIYWLKIGERGGEGNPRVPPAQLLLSTSPPPPWMRYPIIKGIWAQLRGFATTNLQSNWQGSIQFTCVWRLDTEHNQGSWLASNISQVWDSKTLMYPLLCIPHTFLNGSFILEPANGP